MVLFGRKFIVLSCFYLLFSLIFMLFSFTFLSLSLSYIKREIVSRGKLAQNFLSSVTTRNSYLK